MDFRNIPVIICRSIQTSSMLALYHIFQLSLHPFLYQLDTEISNPFMPLAPKEKIVQSDKNRQCHTITDA